MQPHFEEKCQEEGEQKYEIESGFQKSLPPHRGLGAGQRGAQSIAEGPTNTIDGALRPAGPESASKSRASLPIGGPSVNSNGKKKPGSDEGHYTEEASKEGMDDCLQFPGRR